MSVSTLRKSNTLDKLLAQVQSESAPQEKKSYVDERLWKPELDKSGTGQAVIRFLPAPDGEELPWVKVFKHAFQGLLVNGILRIHLPLSVNKTQ